MSYLVLARKWRPKRFAELVGQEHVVRALSNALDTGRVHHAFLFSGTRGVGKTTIARIFAKSLNCERGTSAEPCGECNSCKDIDAGRFIDLLEIDAASNTGVDDVRDLIDNAQYMPSRGRVKVYLIDEVHMLSKSAFNALLKTLEEPPGHVKFLLATTDPQKLPVTVLSRCLQFNLKRLDEAQISGQIDKILAAEGIAVEPGAVRQISKAADGSLRDGLSLLDQAIAYTGGQLTDAAVATMLGTVDQTRVGALLAALADADGDRLLAEVTTLAEFSPDWGSVLEALAEAMHRIQVRQLVPGAAVEADGVDIDGLADTVPAELVQLWYQMAINGRRDLALAPSPRAGFEMSVLRMLAFRPAGPGTARAASAVPARGKPSPTVEPPAGDANAKSGPSANPLMQDDPMRADPATGPLVASSPGSITGPASAPADTATPASSTGSGLDPESTAETRQQIDTQPEAAYPAQVRGEEQLHAGERAISEPAAMPASAATGPDTDPRPAPPASADAALDDAAAWHAWVMASSLKGPARVLAEHVGFIACNNGVLSLALAPVDELLNKPALVRQIAEALAPTLGDVPEIRFQASTGEDGPVSLNERNERVRDERQAAAEHAFMNDVQVQALISQHGARLVLDSIRPIDDV